MNDATRDMMDKMVVAAREGQEIIPMFWQPTRGRSNTVSAAIRAGPARNLLVQIGLDGLGKPMYGAPIPNVPALTHAGTAVMQ